MSVLCTSSNSLAHHVFVYKCETHGLSILLNGVWNVLKPHIYREGIIPILECIDLLCSVDIISEPGGMDNLLSYVLNITGAGLPQCC